MKKSVMKNARMVKGGTLIVTVDIGMTSNHGTALLLTADNSQELGRMSQQDGEQPPTRRYLKRPREHKNIS